MTKIIVEMSFVILLLGIAVTFSEGLSSSACQSFTIFVTVVHQ
jgi:hypothetical protein